MNQNPWHVENQAQYERERIQQEMRQIRLGERASRGAVQRPGPVTRLWLLVRQWLATQHKRAGTAVQRRPTEATNARRQIRV